MLFTLLSLSYFKVLGISTHNKLEGNHIRFRNTLLKGTPVHPTRNSYTAKTVDNLEKFPYEGRAKRRFFKIRNLKNKNKDNTAYYNVIQKADCRGYGGGQNYGNHGGHNGGVGNTVVEGKYKKLRFTLFYLTFSN